MSISESVAILVFTLTGSSVLLVLGSKTITDSFFLFFPKSLEKLIAMVSENSFLNSLHGVLFSFLAQSPSSTSNMAVSFANSGLFSRKQISAFLSGVGLAAVWPLWLIVFNWGWYELIFLSLGFFTVLFTKIDRVIALGRFSLGLGLIILGARLLKVGLSSQPFLSFAAYQTFFSGSLNFSTLLIVFLALLLILFLTRSFFVPLAISLALYDGNFISGHYALVFLVFSFLGLSFLPLLNWKIYSTNVKRALLFQVLSKFLFSIIMIFFSGIYYDFVLSLTTKLILPGEENLVSTHFIPIAFILLNLAYILWSQLVFMPLNKLSDVIIPASKVKEFQKLLFLGEAHNISTALAIKQIMLEIGKMAAMVESMLHLTQEVLGTWSPNAEAVERILKYEAVTDRIQLEMNDYISDLIQLGLTRSQGGKVKSYLRMTKELENIADCCKALFYLQKNLVDTGHLPSSSSTELIKNYFSGLLGSYELLFTDLTDEEESIFKNQTIDESFKVKSMDLNSEYLAILKKLYDPDNSQNTSHWVGEIMYKLDQIHRHTSNLYEAYRGL